MSVGERVAVSSGEPGVFPENSVSLPQQDLPSMPESDGEIPALRGVEAILPVSESLGVYLNSVRVVLEKKPVWPRRVNTLDGDKDIARTIGIHRSVLPKQLAFVIRRGIIGGVPSSKGKKKKVQVDIDDVVAFAALYDYERRNFVVKGETYKRLPWDEIVESTREELGEDPIVARIHNPLHAGEKKRSVGQEEETSFSLHVTPRAIVFRARKSG